MLLGFKEKFLSQEVGAQRLHAQSQEDNYLFCQTKDTNRYGVEGFKCV